MKNCPILLTGRGYDETKCIGGRCKWWLPFANDCAVNVISCILADSTICQNSFWAEEEEETE